MNKDDRAILFGLSLGDGYIFHRNRLKKDKNGIPKYKYESSGIIIGHSINQIEYLEYKVSLLKKILGGSNTIAKYKHLVEGKLYDQCRVQKTHKYFRLIHKALYRANKKVITRSFLDRLNPQAIAIWYMDDGHMRKNVNKLGSVSSIGIDISTYCTEEEVNTIINFFKDKYNIEFKKGFDKRRKLFYIRCNTKEANQFANLVRPYIIPSMHYKIQYALQ